MSKFLEETDARLNGRDLFRNGKLVMMRVQFELRERARVVPHKRDHVHGQPGGVVVCLAVDTFHNITIRIK